MDGSMRGWGITLAGVMLVAGCAGGDHPPPAPLWRGACHWLRGELADVASFEGRAGLGIEDTGDEAVIRLLTDGGEGIVVETVIEMSEAELRAGARGEQVIAPYVTVEGHAGPSYGDWTVDAVVESPTAVFELYDGSEIVIVDVTGAWDRGGEVTARFWVRPPWAPE